MWQHANICLAVSPAIFYTARYDIIHWPLFDLAWTNFFDFLSPFFFFFWIFELLSLKKSNKWIRTWVVQSSTVQKFVHFFVLKGKISKGHSMSRVIFNGCVRRRRLFFLFLNFLCSKLLKKEKVMSELVKQHIPLNN